MSAVADDALYPHVCMGCGHQDDYPLGARCPHCFDFPVHIRMALAACLQPILTVQPEEPAENIPEIMPDPANTPPVNPPASNPGTANQVDPDVRRALISARGDLLVLYRGVWEPGANVPEEARAFAARIAMPSDSKIEVRCFPAQDVPEDLAQPELVEIPADEPAQLSLWRAA
jgi:hypothetical protein